MGRRGPDGRAGIIRSASLPPAADRRGRRSRNSTVFRPAIYALRDHPFVAGDGGCQRSSASKAWISPRRRQRQMIITGKMKTTHEWVPLRTRCSRERPHLFGDSFYRPYVCLSDSSRPFRDEEAVYTRLTTTPRSVAIPLADVDRWTMRDILREYGVEFRLDLADEDDAAYEVNRLGVKIHPRHRETNPNPFCREEPAAVEGSSTPDVTPREAGDTDTPRA